MIREHFDDEKFVVLLLKIGILSCVSTWTTQQQPHQHTSNTQQPRPSQPSTQANQFKPNNNPVHNQAITSINQLVSRALD
jgi:hypothetical protein